MPPALVPNKGRPGHPDEEKPAHLEAFMVFQIVRPAAGGIAAAALLAAMFLGSPDRAAAADPAPGAASPTRNAVAQAAPAPGTPAPDHPSAGEPAGRAHDVEARIKDIHDKLHITEAETPQWNDFAQTMREDAASMRQLIEQQRAKQAGMNAVDELRAYEEFTEASANGQKKIISAFEPLYNSLSPEQKTAADALFSGRLQHHRRHDR
jgi:periplasmic protein CpxP/Spy